MQQQHEDASDVTQSRKLDALRCLPGCIGRMVAKQEQLPAGNSSTQHTPNFFKIMEVMDGGGFATLLKGKLQFGSSVNSQKVAAAKIAVDAVTDDEGQLTEQQKRTYQASMRHEHQIYERLRTTHGSNQGIPTVYFAGGYKEAGDPEHPKKQHFLSFMVMELLGPSVGHLSLELQTYTSNTNLLVNHGLGMLKVLKFMHRNNIVHRDVKPDNFCLPYGVDPLRPTKVDTVYIVDMGMGYECKPDTDLESRDCLYMGTVDYSSVRSLQGYHPSAWDDLEGLAVTLLEMATGSVPFDLVQGDDPLTAERLLQMATQKEKQWQNLLSSPQTPCFIKQWMRHLRSVSPKQPPTAADYTVLEDVLKSALVPSTAAASSAWSSDVSMLQLQQSVAAAVSSRKRPAPAPSATSNMASCMSTILQSKRIKCLQQEDDDTTSMATGLVGFSQGLLCSQAAEE